MTQLDRTPIKVKDGWQINDFLITDQLLADLERISREARYQAPELLGHRIDWLQANLGSLGLTRDECLNLIYGFSFMVDDQAKGS